MEANIDKTKEKLDRWCSAPDVVFDSAQAGEDYRKRARRISDVFSLSSRIAFPSLPWWHSLLPVIQA